MPEQNVFAEYWEQYKRLIPKNASPIQIVESKRAFLAGGQSCLAAICGFLEPGAEPTEEDLRKMDALKAEFDKFYEDILVGNA